jgi:hypothetical protein
MEAVKKASGYALVEPAAGAMESKRGPLLVGVAIVIG